MNDAVLSLRELRRRSGLQQVEVARRCGIGCKTLSSYETGARVSSLKVAHLERILRVYGVSMSEFFSGDFSKQFEGDLPAVLPEPPTDSDPLSVPLESFSRPELEAISLILITLRRFSLDRGWRILEFLSTHRTQPPYKQREKEDWLRIH